METVDLAVPNRNFRDFNFFFFFVEVWRRSCPSARCALAADVISGCIGIFRGRYVSFNDLLDVDIFTKYIKTLKRFYAVVRPVTFLVNCGFNLVIFCICFLLFLPL